MPVRRDILNKPYYLFRPSQLVRRALHDPNRRAARDGPVDVRLPWGASISVRAGDEIGGSILKIGLFDICVSEALWRLLDPGELAVDAGANIGHMTSVMATRLGSRGRVVAVEPHPELFHELSLNVERWRRDAEVAAIDMREIALSDHGGRARLGLPEDFAANRGSASLTAGAGGAAPGHEVELSRLDELLDEDIGVIKIDVEGHELEVLRGAGSLLEAGRVRDIVFEEWSPYPTAVTRLLEQARFTLFSLDQNLLGLSVGPVDRRSAGRAHQAPSYLATREPARALARLRRRGWAVLGTPLV